MPNMAMQKTPMPEEKPEIRNKTFEEVALGYTSEQAQEEANRCLQCKTRPCVKGCPVGVPIPEFIALIQKGEFYEAAQKIKEMNLLPAICGRVCPQESQCEQLCVRGIKGEAVGIGRLERFAADYLLKNPGKQEEKPKSNGHKVAIVGSGPSGLSCAGELARLGYQVTVFEALHKAGGVLVYGIPEFRLPKAIVRQEIDSLKSMGVVFETNFVVGKTATVDELFEEGFEAIFVGSGAGLPSFMKIPGEEYNGVYSANEFLTRINLMKAYQDDAFTPIIKAKKVAVIGGGNVAMDAARCAKRIGADEVTIVYRRTENELPARLEEIHHAKEEGIQFHLLTSPTEILGDENGWVRGMTCIRMELGEPDDSGRRRPKPIADSEFEMDCDCVVMAIGNSPNPLISRTTKGLEVNRHGCLVLSDEEALQTTREGVYAGGDAVTGAATVILAMGAGKTAAESIDRYLQSK